MRNVLDQLRAMTTVVADTGDVEAVRKYRPVDCTTNPSLVLGALADRDSEDLLSREVEAGRTAGKSPEKIVDALTVAAGAAGRTVAGEP